LITNGLSQEGVHTHTLIASVHKEAPCLLKALTAEVQATMLHQRAQQKRCMPWKTNTINLPHTHKQEKWPMSGFPNYQKQMPCRMQA
jgi:hypothetical protein